MAQILNKYDLKYSRRWSALVFVQVFPDGYLPPHMRREDFRDTPVRYVFVKDPLFGRDAKWKLPAGHNKNSESPEETAVRELRGETGIHVGVDNVTYVHKEHCEGKKGPYHDIYFVAWITEPQLREMHPFDDENEGEQPKSFSIDEFYELVEKGDFLQKHYNKLKELGLILPLGRHVRL